MEFQPQARLAIGQLQPTINTSHTYIKGVVTLVWPYSASKQTSSILLAEPDFRLRRNKGQVRVTFHGSSAGAVARSGLTSGDGVLLRLLGADWVEEVTQRQMPGSGIDWGLTFGRRIVLQAQRNGETIIQLNVDRSTPSPEPQPHAVSPTQPGTPNHVHRESAVEVNIPRAATRTSNTWSSPAFLRKTDLPVTSFYGSFNDPFLDDDGWYAKRPSKRAKFGRASSQWRYVDRTPSPEKEDDIELQEDYPNRALDEENHSQPDGLDVDAVIRQHKETEHSIVNNEDIGFQSSVDQDHHIEVPEPVSKPKLNKVDMATTIEAEGVDTRSINDRYPEGSDQNLSPEIDTEVEASDRLLIDVQPNVLNTRTDSLDLHLATWTMPPETENNQHFSIADVPDAPRLQPLPSPGLPIVSPIADRRQVNRSYFEDRHDGDPAIDDQHPVEDFQETFVSTNTSDDEGESHLEQMNINENILGFASKVLEAPAMDSDLVEIEAESLPGEVLAAEAAADDFSPTSVPLQENSESKLQSDKLIRDDTPSFVASDNGHEKSESSIEFPAESSGNNSEVEEDVPREIRQELSDGISINILDDASVDDTSQASYGTQTSIEEVILSEVESDDESIESRMVSREDLASIEEESSSSQGKEEHLVHPDSTKELPISHLVNLGTGVETPIEIEDLDSNGELAEASSHSDKEQDTSPPQALDTFGRQNSGEKPNRQVLHDHLPISTPFTPVSSGNFEDGASDETRNHFEHEVHESLERNDTSFKAHLATPDATQRADDTDLRTQKETALLVEEEAALLGKTLVIPTPGPIQVSLEHEIPLPSHENIPSKPKRSTSQEYAYTLDDRLMVKPPSKAVDEDVPMKTYHGTSPSDDNSYLLDVRVSANIPSEISDDDDTSRRTEPLDADSLRDVPIDAAIEDSTKDPIDGSVGSLAKSPSEMLNLEQGAEDRQVPSSNLPNDSKIAPNGQHSDVVLKKPVLGITTALSYYVPLSNLGQYFSSIIDVLAITVASTKAARAKSGPHDMHQTIYLTDPSVARDPSPLVTAQLFRPYQKALPLLQTGDPILLRDFKVQMQRRKMMLLSTATSAWAVLYPGEDAQIRGPPVEFGPEEGGIARGLRSWWDSLDMKAKERIEASVPRDNIGSKSADKEAAKRRRSSAGRHELRSGTFYLDRSAMESDSIHELRDGTTYTDS